MVQPTHPSIFPKYSAFSPMFIRLSYVRPTILSYVRPTFLKIIMHIFSFISPANYVSIREFIYPYLNLENDSSWKYIFIDLLWIL